MKIQFMTLVLAAAFIAAPTVVLAGDSAPRASYSSKKQGGIAFKAPTQSTADEISASVDAAHPADIEPAAGGFDAAKDTTKDGSVAASMKLPRKN